MTVSYDGYNPADLSSKRKTSKGLEVLNWFRETYNGLRDTAVVVTINRENFLDIPKIIKEMSDLGHWTLFDFIHPDRGQYGSKCKNNDETKKLLFRKEDLPKLCDVLFIILGMKEIGYLVHWPKELLAFVIKRPEVLLKYDWHCVEYIKQGQKTTNPFPSWITIDNTGEVYCCDDFQIKDRKEKFYIWEIADKWWDFRKYWLERTRKECPGCLWNTHWTSNQTAVGNLPFEDYIHEGKIK